MKQSKEDLLKKIDTLEIPDDIKVVIMEDIADSFEEVKADDDYKGKYEELLGKYKARFLDGTEPEKATEEKTEEMEEKEVIDVKEI